MNEAGPRAVTGKTAGEQALEVLMTSDEDFTQLDDPAFLAERARIRDELEHTPEHSVSTGLTGRYQAMNEEFLRRASAAWGGSQ